MDKKICENCGIENEAEYTYCKNCGNELNKQPYSPVYNENGYGQPKTERIDTNLGEMDFDGVRGRELELFVSSRSESILPKFAKLQTGSKVAFCWPAAILGFTLGPLGVAIWLFYRKMYKPAILFSIVGAFILGVSNIFYTGFDYSALTDLFESFAKGGYQGFLNDITSSDVLNRLLGENNVFAYAVKFAETVIYIATGLLSGLFILNTYRKYSIKRIKEYKACFTDLRCYETGLSLAGGTCPGLLILGITLYVLATYLGTFATILF